MPMDVAFFEKDLANYQMDCVSDHSHTMDLQRDTPTAAAYN